MCKIRQCNNNNNNHRRSYRRVHYILVNNFNLKWLKAENILVLHTRKRSRVNASLQYIIVLCLYVPILYVVSFFFTSYNPTSLQIIIEEPSPQLRAHARSILCRSFRYVKNNNTRKKKLEYYYLRTTTIS